MYGNCNGPSCSNGSCNMTNYGAEYQNFIPETTYNSAYDDRQFGRIGGFGRFGRFGRFGGFGFGGFGVPFILGAATGAAFSRPYPYYPPYSYYPPYPYYY